MAYVFDYVSVVHGQCDRPLVAQGCRNLDHQDRERVGKLARWNDRYAPIPRRHQEHRQYPSTHCQHLEGDTQMQCSQCNPIAADENQGLS